VGQPVVHFEIIGNDPQTLRDYYAGLFGWAFQTPSPVAQEVSEAGSYGFLDLITSEDGTGIRGGVGGGPSYESHAVFYVGVPNVEAALKRAESLGVPRPRFTGHCGEQSDHATAAWVGASRCSRASAGVR
jgi:predicted enzyme related to lactoylglutathione lyase